MKVYNLTTKPLDFHGHVIPPNGGHKEIPVLDAFVSNRDRDMAKRGVISFHQLPLFWRPASAPKVAKVVPPAVVLPTQPLPEEAKVILKEEPKADKVERKDRWKKHE